MFIGIDDTDSRSGMCTTYLCKEAIDLLEENSFECKTPRLIRLNPNIPYKTRGNGALSFEVEGDEDKIWDIMIAALDKYKMDGPATNPGLILLNNEVPDVLHDFYNRALHEHVLIEEAHALAKKIGARIKYYGNGRGIIGSLASIGALLPDYTYELIAYRMPERRGTKRYVDNESVKKVDTLYSPVIFDSYDWKNKYTAIAPNAPCPVLYGIRGDESDLLFKAADMIVSEPIYKRQLFVTNQATDAHIVEKHISEFEEYDSVHCHCQVTTKPDFAHKGHLFFSVKEDSNTMLCAAYEPTKEFRAYVAALLPGDEIEIWGGVKRTSYGLTVNLEKIKILSLVEVSVPVVPTCCGKKMNSIGSKKGYRCKKCRRKIPYCEVKFELVERNISKGFYEVPVIARRHLSKPLARMPPVLVN